MLANRETESLEGLLSLLAERRHLMASDFTPTFRSSIAVCRGAATSDNFTRASRHDFTNVVLEIWGYSPGRSPVVDRRLNRQALDEFRVKN